ncbi:MAG: hypothetical protein OEW75_03790 [Cyclobacteriaceae bacterium]|nr:hypothetical protein [Cyclobacteriaceae bacterium]
MKWIIIILLPTLSCTSIERQQPLESLECLLDVYLESLKSYEPEVVRISYVDGWTDSTAIVRILSYDSEELLSGNFLSARYRGIKLLLSLGLLDSGNIYQSNNIEFPIPNNLNWQEVTLSDELDKKKDLFIEFDEVQFTHQRTLKCIREVIMGEEFRNLLKTDCQLCD